jgi:hypothetical protein
LPHAQLSSLHAEVERYKAEVGAVAHMLQQHQQAAQRQQQQQTAPRSSSTVAQPPSSSDSAAAAVMIPSASLLLEELQATRQQLMEQQGLMRQQTWQLGESELASEGHHVSMAGEGGLGKEMEMM